MTVIAVKGDPRRRALEKARRDPVVRALLTKAPDEILAHWNNASPAEQKQILGRVILLVAGLARDIDFE